MKFFLLKIRKLTGWSLVTLSVLLMIFGFLVLIPSISDFLNIESSKTWAASLYALSIPPWYLGLVLLGPDIIAKLRGYYNVIKKKIWSI